MAQARWPACPAALACRTCQLDELIASDLLAAVVSGRLASWRSAAPPPHPPSQPTVG